MIRSFFGVQEGDFSLSIYRIRALCEAPAPGGENLGITKNVDARQLESGTAGTKEKQSLLPLQSAPDRSPTVCMAFCEDV